MVVIDKMKRPCTVPPLALSSADADARNIRATCRQGAEDWDCALTAPVRVVVLFTLYFVL